MYLAANLSMLFDDRPMVERFGAAAAAGFKVVEIQFPHLHPLEELQRAREAAGVEMVLINVPAGNPDRGEAGLAALPGREADFRDAVETCATYARGLGEESPVCRLIIGRLYQALQNRVSRRPEGQRSRGKAADRCRA